MNQIQKKIISRFKKLISKDGFTATSVPGVELIQFSADKPWSRTYWRSSIVIIVQGRKEITLETHAYKYKEANYIITPVGLPVLSRIVLESKDKPFLAMRLPLDPLDLKQVASQIPSLPQAPGSLKTHGIFTGPVTENLLQAILRLCDLSPEDAPVIGPLIIKEVYYHLLRTPNGHSLLPFVMKGSKLQKISEAIRMIRSDLQLELDVEELATAASMSRTLFFSTFKKVTAMSPVQLQKKLRLLEAKHLLSQSGETAEQIAYSVGYKSPSQFSREYTRMFGHSPGRESRRT